MQRRVEVDRVWRGDVTSGADKRQDGGRTVPDGVVDEGFPSSRESGTVDIAGLE